MDREDILERVNEIFWDVFDDEDLEINESTCADDIEDWDSLTHITLISAVENEFGFKFSMKEVQGMQDVGEMIDIIEREMA